MQPYPPGISPPPPPRREVRRRRLRRWGGILVVSLLGGGLAAWWTSSLWTARYLAWRGERFAEQAGAALRLGRLREAEVHLKSALAHDPARRDLRLAEATLAWRLGRRTEAAAAWRAILERTEDAARAPLARSCALQLLAGGWYPELCDHAVREMARDPGESLWLMLAAEAGRLTAGRGETPPSDGNRPAAILLRAYVAQGRAQAAGVRRELHALDHHILTYPEAVLAARAWSRLGAEAEARGTFLRLNRALFREELVAHELLFAPPESSVARPVVRALLSSARSPEAVEAAVLRLVVHGLGQAERGAAEDLTRRCLPSAGRLTPTTLTALWLFCGQARFAEGERLWRQRLESGAGDTLPCLLVEPPRARVLAILIGRVPLPFELAYAVLAVSGPAAVPTPAAPVPATNDQNQPMRPTLLGAG
ncbi:MAG: hypothetical protein HZC55_03085 [Verrucomicrobia bacterium]|nr:hypothetical protein [Verrucomicrobiota bacterium]